MNNKKLALFDYDGTITWIDSFFLFICFSFLYRPLHHFWVSFDALRLYWKFKRGVLSRHDSKQGIFSNYFGGLSLSEYHDLCSRFSRSILPLICCKAAMKKLQDHLKNGDQVFLVSASPITYLQKWAAQYPLNVIATKEEQNDLSLTGNFDSINCWGEEKAIQIKLLLDPSSFDEVHVYGNSKGDCGMFALATHSYYKRFDQTNIPPCK